MCGEQGGGRGVVVVAAGSPPRVRGTVRVDDDSAPPGWITPACAGNSVQRRIPGRRDGDHPRVCGEQVVAAADLDRLHGSPPRVRGTGFLTCRPKDQICCFRSLRSTRSKYYDL